MSKVLKFSVIVFPFALINFVLVANAFADDNLPVCTVTTEPSVITNNTVLTPKAKFIVNVGQNKFSSYNIEFECGLIKNEQPATIDGNNIYVERTAGGCEFDTSQNPNHTLKVKAITSNGNIDQCRGNYSVIDAKTQCKVTLSPDSSDITSNTKITAAGENLANGGRFGVFVDNDPITNTGGIIETYLTTPSFSGVAIPGKYMTPGTHQVDIREWGLRLTVGFRTDIIRATDFTDPLCSATFLVGTLNNPGKLLPQGGSSAATGPCTKDCSSAGGQQVPGCTDNKDNPGISTAIGCIHTEPVALIKDFLKFLTAISGGLAFLMMLLGAFQMITSAGNPETLQAGRDRFQSAIIGLLFVIFAVLLLKIIGVDILGLGEQFGFKP